MIDNDENIDEMVDEIFGDIDAGSKPPHEYKLACVRCGDVFTARTEGAQFCPSCRQIVRREAGRKGAEKAHGLKAEEKPKAAGASPRPTDADQSGERIAAAHAGPRNDEAANAICSVPAADVRPVVRGEWVKTHRHTNGYRTYTGFDDMGEEHTITVHEESEYTWLNCPYCGASAADNFQNFCPACGADMRKERDNGKV